MGVMKEMHRQAERVKKGSAGRQGSMVTITQSDFSLINKFPDEFQMKVATKALNAAGKIVQDAYKANLKDHRSRTPREYTWINSKGNAVTETVASRDKWSAKIRKQREWRGTYDLYRAVGMKRINFRRTGTLLNMVGVKRPHGSHANLVEYGANVNLWGTGRIWRMPPFAPLRRATDETKGRQRRAIETVAKVEAKRLFVT